MKKVPRTVQPAHRAPTVTVAQAIRAWRMVEAEKKARQAAPVPDSADLVSRQDPSAGEDHARHREL